MLTPPATSYRLRPMHLTDIPVVLDIEKLSLPTPSKRGIFEHELTNNALAHYQVLERYGSGIIGYSGYWLIVDEVHIIIIAIHPDWRKRGLGELLLLNMLAITHPHAPMVATLEVRASNIAAQTLYKKHDFCVVNKRPRYYQNGETALVMNVELPLPNFNQRVAGLLARLISEAKSH